MELGGNNKRDQGKEANGEEDEGNENDEDDEDAEDEDEDAEDFSVEMAEKRVRTARSKYEWPPTKGKNTRGEIERLLAAAKEVERDRAAIAQESATRAWSFIVFEGPSGSPTSVHRIELSAAQRNNAQAVTAAARVLLVLACRGSEAARRPAVPPPATFAIRLTNEAIKFANNTAHNERIPLSRLVKTLRNKGSAFPVLGRGGCDTSLTFVKMGWPAQDGAWEAYLHRLISRCTRVRADGTADVRNPVGHKKQKTMDGKGRKAPKSAEHRAKISASLRVKVPAAAAPAAMASVVRAEKPEKGVAPVVRK